jgi:hypothetical protein
VAKNNFARFFVDNGDYAIITLENDFFVVVHNKLIFVIKFSYIHFTLLAGVRPPYFMALSYHGGAALSTFCQ